MSLAPDQAVILTYHRIPADDLEPKFHDLPFDRFASQMRIIAGRQINSTDARVYITFDDGTADHAMAGDLLYELGLTGIFFVITGRLGQKGYLTRQQVVQLGRQGHVLGSHGISHHHLTRLSPAELDTELRSSKSFLEDLVGAAVDTIAPPGGVYDRHVVDRAMALGYRMIRTMDWGYAARPPEGCVDCLPVLPHYSQRAFERLLDGKALLWPFRLKNRAKDILGERLYNVIRNRLTN